MMPAEPFLELKKLKRISELRICLRSILIRYLILRISKRILILFVPITGLTAVCLSARYTMTIMI